MPKLHQRDRKKSDKMSESLKNCNNPQALCNHQYYPDIDGLDNHMEESPKYHWASLFQLIEKVSDGKSFGFIPRETWCIADSSGKLTYLHVYKDYSESEKPVTFSVSNLQPGKTFAILYPRTMRNAGIMLNYTNFDNGFVFDGSLKNVHDEADKLLKAADCMHFKEAVECFGCNKKINESELITCPDCKLAKYCSKKCQDQCLKRHNGLCKHSEVLLRLAALPRQEFKNENLNFDIYEEKDDNSPYFRPIPAYKPDHKKKYHETIPNLSKVKIEINERTGEFLMPMEDFMNLLNMNNPRAQGKANTARARNSADKENSNPNECNIN